MLYRYVINGGQGNLVWQKGPFFVVYKKVKGHNPEGLLDRVIRGIRHEGPAGKTARGK